MSETHDNGAAPQKGVLGWIERTGNRLPDPVFIFFWLIAALVVISVIASATGYSALHPTQKAEDGSDLVISAVSLLAADNIRRLWVEMPATFTHFHPLGYVLVVMLGPGSPSAPASSPAPCGRGCAMRPNFC